MGANLGLAVLRFAQADLAADVRETSRNDGPRIREYAARFGLVPPINWCSSALGTWLQDAAKELGIKPPIAGSAGARATMGQFMAAGLWVPWQELTPDDLEPGNVPIWWRVRRDSWQGHIGIIERVDGIVMQTIEGNSGLRGDRVARMVRSADDVQLLGVGLLSSIDIPYEPTQHELETAARLMKLGAEVMLGEPRDPLGGIEEMW